MLIKKYSLFLLFTFSLWFMLPFCHAHVCGDVVGGSQAGCPDPQTVEYITHSIDGNVVTIETDITAKHIVWVPRCTVGSSGCYPASYNGGVCNSAPMGDFTSGFTVESFSKSLVPGGHGDIGQISVSSSPTLSYDLSDRETQRFYIYLTIDPDASTQHFDVRVAMTGSLSGTARPVYDVTINWVNDGCTAETNTEFCNRLNKNCGSVTAPDNCGTSRSVNCGTCTLPQTCNAANICSCSAETNTAFCTRLNKNCGSVTAPDNCGNSRTVSSCGTCTLPQTCNAANICSCSAETNTAFCTRLNKNCGSVTAPDNCGASRSVNCGTCTLPQTCNAANICSCTVSSYNPALNTFCGSRSVTTNCGTTVTMTGTLTCTLPQTCNAANICSCSAETNTAFCTRLNKNCGSVTAPDNCGNSRTVSSCGSCSGTCNDGVCSVCTAETNTTFCTRLNKNCGSVTALDNCGNSRTVSSCGTCNSPQTCNTTNMCSCTAETNTAFCTRLNKNCGNVTALDNCGTSRTNDCGSCSGTCNDGVCSVCTAETNTTFCTRLNKNCGNVTALDNCGTSRTVYSCGTCTLPQTCSSSGLCQEDSGDGEENDSSVKVYSATKSQLIEGDNRIYSSGDSLKMSLSGESHKVAIENINSTAAKINVSSKLQQAVLFIGETKKFSFTSGWYNLTVTLNKITGNGKTAKANITVMSIGEKISGVKVCKEDWECEEWGNCFEGKQERICTDLNNCDSEDKKPKTEQTCGNSNFFSKKMIYILISIAVIISIILFIILKRNIASLSTQSNSTTKYPAYNT